MAGGKRKQYVYAHVFVSVSLWYFGVLYFGQYQGGVLLKRPGFGGGGAEVRFKLGCKTRGLGFGSRYKSAN